MTNQGILTIDAINSSAVTNYEVYVDAYNGAKWGGSSTNSTYLILISIS